MDAIAATGATDHASVAAMVAMDHPMVAALVLVMVAMAQ